VALLAFARSTPLLLTAGHALIDRYLVPAGPATANSPNAAAAGKWDSQTDRRTPGASIPS